MYCCQEIFFYQIGLYVVCELILRKSWQIYESSFIHHVLPIISICAFSYSVSVGSIVELKFRSEVSCVQNILGCWSKNILNLNTVVLNTSARETHFGTNISTARTIEARAYFQMLFGTNNTFVKRYGSCCASLWMCLVVLLVPKWVTYWVSEK